MERKAKLTKQFCVVFKNPQVYTIQVRHMAKSHCMSRHAARECSRGRAKKKWPTEPDETIKLLMWSKEKLFLSFP